MNKTIKIVLAILFLICLLDMPYGFYQFVRLSAMIGFTSLAYTAYKQNNKLYIPYICLAILFQPFIKITLGRELWNIIDVLVGIVLIVSVFINPKSSKQ